MKKIKKFFDWIKDGWAKLTAADTDERYNCEFTGCRCDELEYLALAVAELKIHGGCELCANCNMDSDPYCDDADCCKHDHWIWHGFPENPAENTDN